MERSKQENQGHQETLTHTIITGIPSHYVTVSNFFLLSIREPVMPAAHINACIVVIIMKWSMNEKHERKHWNPLHTISTGIPLYHCLKLLLSASSIESMINVGSVYLMHTSMQAVMIVKRNMRRQSHEKKLWSPCITHHRYMYLHAITMLLFKLHSLIC